MKPFLPISFALLVFLIGTAASSAPTINYANACPARMGSNGPVCPDGGAPILSEDGYGGMAYYCLGTQCSSIRSSGGYAPLSGSKPDVAPATNPTTTSVTADVATDATIATVTTIQHIGETATGKQSEAAVGATNISEQASANRATIGAVECAEGANADLAESGAGAGAIASCKEKFAKANELAKMSAKGTGTGALKVDPAVMASPDVQGILQKFEENFGVNGGEYVSRMLSARGSQQELRDILSSKFSDEKLDYFFATAEEAQPAELAVPGVSEVKVAKAKVNTSLRDSLRAKLETNEASRSLASAGQSKAKEPAKAPAEPLQPADINGLINGSEQEQEIALTIFDVIHQKLQSLKQREKI